MGILAKAPSLFEKEPFPTYLTTALYIFPILAVLLLVFRRGANVHKLAKLPLAGVTAPGYIGLLEARQKFVKNGREMLKEAYYKARQRCSIYSWRHRDIRSDCPL